MKQPPQTKCDTSIKKKQLADAEIVTNYEKCDFETAIEQTGYGRFHYMLLAICGLASSSEEMDILSMSFILPSAQCDLDLTTETKGYLNSVIFLGMMVGAYAWGSVADSLGRKNLLIIISIINGIAIVCSSFSQSYEVFMFFRFLNGAALGGSGPVIWSYFAEFQPKRKRGAMLSFMASFWTIGNLCVAGIAWLIIPNELGGEIGGFVYNSWRIFLLVMALPSFMVAGLLFLLPESPKFLLSQGKDEDAVNILKNIYYINTGNPCEEYPVKHIINENTHHVESDGTKTGFFKDIIGHSKELFTGSMLKFTVVIITINLTFHIGYYGITMWFPEMFERFDVYAEYHNNTVDANICQVTTFIAELNAAAESESAECVSEIEDDVFLETVITVGSAVPSNILAVLGMDRLGRRFFMVFSTFSAGLCSAAMYYVYNKTNYLIVCAVFSSVISCGNASLDCLVTEGFPTHLRATGVAVAMVAARLGGIVGNMVIAELLDTYCPVPTFIVAFLLAGGGLTCLLLQSTTRKALA